MKWVLRGLACLALCLLVNRSGGQSFYQEPETLPLVAAALAPVVEDFNRDGRPDIALVFEEEGKVGVILNDGETPLPDPVTYPVGDGPIFVTSGDLDGEGSKDLFVVNTGSATVSVLLNKGDGCFGNASQVPVGVIPRVGKLGEFNDDGNLDAVVTNLASKDMTVLLGDGQGGFFEKLPIEVGDNPHSIVAADFDGDQVDDVVVAHFLETAPAGDVSLYRGLGKGTLDDPVFADPVDTRLPIGFKPVLLGAGDLDRDGDLDLAVQSQADAIFVLDNLGNGNFKVLPAGETQGANAGAFSSGFFVVEDFDGDTHLDLISPLERLGNKGIRIHRGLGAAAFEPRDFFLTGSVTGVALADFDEDTLMDVVGAMAGAPALTFVRGKAPGRLVTRTVVPLEVHPLQVAAVDANRDGAADLAALSTGALNFAFSDSAGDFEPPTEHEFESSAFQDMTAADFDGDGHQELALSDLAGGEVLLVTFDMSGAVTNTTGLSVSDLPGNLPGKVVAADFDGDGFLDVAVTNQGLSTVTVLLRPGKREEPDANELRIEIEVGSAQTAIDAADVDLDGAQDVAVATRDGIRIRFGDGKGEFPASHDIDDFQRSPALRVADLDGSGTSDLLVVFQRKVVILYGVVATENPLREEIDLDEDISALEVRDADGDGRLDILATAPGGLIVLPGLPAGGFEEPLSHTVGSSPRALVLAHLDDDSRLDCCTADLGSRSLSVLHGASPQAAESFRRGDVDQDGQVRLTDAILIVERLFQGRSALDCPDAADTDDDGRMVLTDVIYLLDYLFRGGALPPAPGPHACGPEMTLDDLAECAGPCS